MTSLAQHKDWKHGGGAAQGTFFNVAPLKRSQLSVFVVCLLVPKLNVKAGVKTRLVLSARLYGNLQGPMCQNQGQTLQSRMEEAWSEPCL